MRADGRGCLGRGGADALAGAALARSGQLLAALVAFKSDITYAAEGAERTMRQDGGEATFPRAWLTPVGKYYFELLSLWVVIGGDLKFSRNRRNNTVKGPLISFIEAAANPVLGPAAAKRSTLPDIINLAKRIMDDGRLKTTVSKLRRLDPASEVNSTAGGN